MSSGKAVPRRVLVAAPTYRRNDLLDGLLKSLSELTLPDDAETRFVIIDNDPAQGARPVVEKWQGAFPAPLDYEAEADPGVTHVRNRALELAAGFDLLAFIDDDEFAHPDWLAALLRRHAETGAAGVFGPVDPVYPDTAPGWLKSWAVHGTKITEDADQTKPGATCNCLIDMNAVRAEGLRFDSRMSLTGAEDTLFFTELLDRGHRLTQARAAQVYEHIPEERVATGWLLRRWYRTGLTDALIAGRKLPPILSRLRAGVHGVVRVIAGALLVALAALVSLGQNQRAILSRAYTVSRGLGMISYALGGRYEEYGKAMSRPAGLGL
ncbi:MAG: glycosyltransferase family 2 protein [Hyphomonas sp.]